MRMVWNSRSLKVACSGFSESSVKWLASDSASSGVMYLRPAAITWMASTSFSGAVFFGFSGTPIHKENVRKDNTTTDVFGDELHRYSIADGIRDGNVLGFDPYKVCTFKDKDLRQAVALEQAKADSVADAMSTAAKKKKFNFFERNRSLLEKNPRIGMSYVTLNKMSTNQRQELLKQADFYLEHINIF